MVCVTIKYEPLPSPDAVAGRRMSPWNAAALLYGIDNPGINALANDTAVAALSC